ncbi:nicotinate-nucleotide adenylyltransferase [Paucidesulfovibrio gracilis DSM 16080]|uniref:Probable nicotinate-nucleotide adenylyltransferase n=1 Tax=Paucidesulfovibrio gracilis DSM 16080 TaxID=1121449 RepID=A0A1T4W1I1_9BACT|nr:nicotinate (nicotinamide) nucleotide adenylyltransferase [Paucidesulfovibrio gracilis]SKA70908.1 nicotinate-nucleotide adenylyltransferase [Paucidesulfovibrio gracilis DSM 16080]
MEPRQGVGILGGSFNPVHTGHVRMALEVLERLRLERVDLVPASIPPHKPMKGLLPFDIRLGLCELAVEGIHGLRANPIEGERSGPSYTCDTLECYPTPPQERFFILGAGTLLEIPTWRHGLEIPALANLVCVNRGGDRCSGFEPVTRLVEERWPDATQLASGREPSWRFSSGARLLCLSVPRLEIKARDIRERWLQGRDLSLLVPPAVQRALQEDGSEFVQAWGRPQTAAGEE